MSNIIPPLLSNTPPPPPSPEEEDDDEFGDFTGANDLSYGCDNLSLPPSPDHSPKIVSIPNGLDINSNSEKNKVTHTDLGTEKDFQDKRKGSESVAYFNNPEEKCIEIVPENIVEYSENAVSDTLQISEKFENNSNTSLNDDGDLNGVDETLPQDAKIECSFFSQQSAVESIKRENEETQEDNNSLAQAEENQIPLNYTVDSNVIGCNELSTEENAISNLSTKLENNRDVNGVIDDSKNISSKLEQDLVNSEIVKEVHSFVSNEIDSCEEFDKNVESPPLAYLEENIVPCFKKDTEDCKTSEDGLIWAAFEKHSINKENTISSIHKKPLTDDEFGDFTFADADFKSTLETEQFTDYDLNIQSATIKNDKDEEKESMEKVENKNVDPKEIPVTASSSNTVVSGDKLENFDTEDDFDDFCKFTSNTNVREAKQSEVLSLNQDNSDFNNFADFSEIVEEPVILLLNEKQALEKSDSILKMMFPALGNIEEEFQNSDIEKDDYIFNELKDITETNALTYQWSKSASQNMLLKALNIDARNILYGGSWNPSMPRFAANLGLTPLEPIKTEVPALSTLKSSPSTSLPPPSNDIPSAQFDWNGSGLVNPLDYSQTMLLDLEQLVASLDIPICNTSSNSNNSSSPANELNDWDIWLQSVPKESVEKPQTSEFEKFSEPTILQPQVIAKPSSEKVPSKNDLEEEVMSSKQNIDDFEDFTSYQISTGSETWQNIVPLRETYISNEPKELPLDIVNWLQPTIVTPELPRRDLEIGDEELPNIQTPEFTRKQVSLNENDDEFDDFQMVLPEADSSKNCIKINSGFLQPIQAQTVETPSTLNMGIYHSAKFTFPEEKPKIESISFVNNLRQSETTLEPKEMEGKGSVTFEDDDDFTEFHSSVPAPQLVVPEPLTPILEPLKPVPVYSSVSVASPTQINWPDPGITDEEIKKFEMVFQRPQEYHNRETKMEEPTKHQEKPKEVLNNSSVDDDEWSDFVSVQKPSPVHKFQSSEKDRTSSPDLPLSVLNLGNIQPTKQPIPVITPHGLIQTKLSSNNPVSLSPKQQLKNAQHKPVHQKQSVHPSIISNQFASQIHTFNSGGVSKSKAVLNLNQPQSTSSNLQPLDDDDWSDFISSPLPTSTTANGYQQNWQTTSTYNHSNWTIPSPNIITNPRHFVQSGSDVKNKIVPNLTVNNKKCTIPSISLPELEFIGPKGRTSSSRKK